MSGAARRPRVVLVDDDRPIRQLVALALEELPIELVLCADAAEARVALAAGPVALLITDLMMPGESGLALLTALAADPALRGPARLAVFSAGLGPAVRAQLAELDVWRLLDKPVSMAALEQCVAEALALAPMPPPRPEPAAPPAGGEPLDAAEHAAVARAFGGDLALFLAFRRQARQQFADDQRVLAAALAAGDWPALRRTAHSLKGVLALLGDDPGQALASRLEKAASTGDGAGCHGLVPSLSAHIDTRIGWSPVNFLQKI